MENVLNSVKPFGKFQKYSILLVGLSSALIAMLTYSTVFILADPELICKLKNQSDSISSKILNESLEIDVCQIWSNISQIESKNSSSTDYTCEFDKTHYGLSIVNEWGLVCEKKYLASLTQTFFLIGTFTGIFIGPFSDKFGRKMLSIILLILLCCTITLSEILQMNFAGLTINMRYIIFSISQFIIGSCSNSIYSVLFILLLELTTKEHTTSVTGINLYMFVAGELAVMVMAFFLRNWHIINWILAAYSAIVAILIGIFLPESPRYLVQKKKRHEAFIVLKKIWKINNLKERRTTSYEEGTIENLLKRNDAEFFNLNASIIQKFDKITNDQINAIQSNDSNLQRNNEKKDTSALNFILKSSKNLIQTIILVFISFSITLCYFGITSVGHINPYLIYFFGSVAEFIGYFLCCLNDKLGRKKMLVAFLILAGISCLSVALLPQNPTDKNMKENSYLKWSTILIILFVSFGKMMVSAASNSAFIYVSQLYPTGVRATFLLFISSIGRLSAIISPFINLLGAYVWVPLPYFVFSSSAFLAGFLVLILPDPAKLGYF